MDKNTGQLPLPDKKIPLSVMIIGTFEIAVALLSLIVLAMAGRFDARSFVFLVSVIAYGAMGLGPIALTSMFSECC